MQAQHDTAQRMHSDLAENNDRRPGTVFVSNVKLSPDPRVVSRRVVLD